jgi:hypothetical protein
MTALQEWEIAYVAGLIDGEGSIGMYKDGKNKPLRPTLCINMTDKVAIDFALRVLGEGRIRIIPSKQGLKTQYRIKLTSQQANKAVLLLYPYLLVKKKPAKEIIKHYSET